MDAGSKKRPPGIGVGGAGPLQPLNLEKTTKTGTAGERPIRTSSDLPTFEPPPPNAVDMRAYAAAAPKISFRRWMILRSLAQVYDDPGILEGFGRLHLGREAREVKLPEPHPAFDLVTLPSVDELPVPTSLKEAAAAFMAKHPEVANDPRLADGGKNLILHSLKYVDFERLRARGVHGVSNLEFGTGERLQMGYAMRLLSALLPNCKMQNDPPGFVMDGVEAVELNIRDRAEMPMAVDQPNELEMRMFKPSNALTAMLPRDELREYFRIPPEAKVLALYTGCPWCSSGMSESQVIDTALETYEPDVVLFLRRSGSYVDLKKRGFDRHITGFKEILRADQESPEAIDLSNCMQSRVALDLDVIGYAPYVYTLADMAVVHGAINGFEPLNAGCPTVVAFPFTGSDYDPAMRTLIDQAQVTNGFMHIESPEAQAEAMKSLGERGRIPVEERPFNQPGERGATRLEDAFIHVLEAGLGVSVVD